MGFGRRKSSSAASRLIVESRISWRSDLEGSEAGVVSVVKTGDDFDLVHQHDFQQRVSATLAIDDSTVYIRTKMQLLQ